MIRDHRQVRARARRGIVLSSRQSGVRMAIVRIVGRSAVLRRVEVCCTLSLAIAIALGVRGLVCDECVCAEQSVRAPILSAIVHRRVCDRSHQQHAQRDHGAHLCSCGKNFFGEGVY